MNRGHVDIGRWPSPIEVFLALLFVTLVVAGSARASDTPHDPVRFIDDFADRVVNILGGQGPSAGERHAAFRVLLHEGFDLPTIGRAVLGRHWRSASNAQRSAFLELFEDYVIATYYRRLEAYSGQRLVAGTSHPVGRNDVMVDSYLDHAGDSGIALKWRLRPVDDGWRIIDVLVEGVSMAITLRSEFAALIERGGGRFDALLDALRSKNDDVTLVSAG